MEDADISTMPVVWIGNLLAECSKSGDDGCGVEICFNNHIEIGLDGDLGCSFLPAHQAQKAFGDAEGFEAPA